jgi:hypothetical protein
MDMGHQQRRRFLAIILASMAMVAACSACTCNGPGTSSTPTPTPQNGVKITICAVDPLQAKDFPGSGCGSGAYAALNSTADIQVTARSASGQALAHLPLVMTRHGTNGGGSSTVTTGANGQATFTYAGSHTGTDTVVASLSAPSAPKAGGVVIDWIPKQAMTRPIIWVHGIHEDATDFAHEIHGTHDPDQSADASEQTWTSLLDALTTTYNPSAIQPFCYVDDIAWTNKPDTGCPTDETPCTVKCISEGSVLANATQLAKLVTDMDAEYHHTVTLMAYSMGGAIVRTLLAGCLTSPYNSVTNPGQPECLQAAADIDHVFLLNPAQEGSWLLTAANMTGFSEADLSNQAASPFSAVLSLIQQGLFSVVQAKLHLDLSGDAIGDLTPQSANIDAHNSWAPQTNADFYTFYGDISVGVQIKLLNHTLAPQTLLPLGDLVFLPQADPATATPQWGGAALCQGCSTPSGQPYESSLPSLQYRTGQYHQWALTEQYTIPMTDLGSMLNGLSNSQAALQGALNSPVQHLNISQPGSQDPGSSLQVRDITGLAGGPTTTMSNEIYLILVQADKLE